MKPPEHDYDSDPNSDDEQRRASPPRRWTWPRLLGFALVIPGVVSYLASDVEVIMQLI